MDIVAQAIGIVAMLVGAYSLTQKNTKSIIFIQIFSSFLFGINYFLIGAYAGASLNILSLIRNLIIRQKKRNWANPKIWFPIIIVSFALAVYFSGNGLLGLLPLSGCVFMSIGLYIDDGSKARRFIVCSSPCWLIYNIINFAIGGIIAEIINLASLMSAFIRFDLRIKKH